MTVCCVVSDQSERYLSYGIHLCCVLMLMCTSFSPQQFSALQMVVREINETVNQEVALTNEELNEVIVYPFFKEMHK